MVKKPGVVDEPLRDVVTRVLDSTCALVDLAVEHCQIGATAANAAGTGATR
jgi:hypothetical protein